MESPRNIERVVSWETHPLGNEGCRQGSKVVGTCHQGSGFQGLSHCQNVFTNRVIAVLEGVGIPVADIVRAVTGGHYP